MGSPSPSSPVTQTTQVSQMDPRLYQWMYGTPNSPGRQQIANASMLAKTMQGVQNADPTALAAYYNVPKGTDLSQFQSHTGAMSPGQTDRALMQLPGQSVTPQDYYKQATAGDKEQKKEPTSTQIAKAGGEIQGYKKGAKLDQPTADLNEYGVTATQQKKWDNYEKMRNAGKKFTQQQLRDYNAIKDTRTQYTAANPQQSTGKTPLSLSDAQQGVTAFYDPEKMQSTNPYYNQAVDVLKGMGNMPSEYGKASDAYSNLQNMANYTPQQVAAQDAQAASMNAASLGRDTVRDIAAQQAQVERMQGGPNVEAIQAQANQMDDPMQVRAARTRAAQMQGPESWTSQGTSQQYMDPYVQNALSAQQSLANQQFAQQQNQLRSQAAKSKAYGGSRDVLARQSAQTQQNLLNQNLAAQGLSQAYQTGMGQFNTAQGQGLQAGQANLGAQMQANLANQQARMQAQQLNQAAGLTTGQANLSAAQQTELANQQAGMTAQQLNQLYGQGGFQSNAANQAAQNQAYNNYVAQMLAAQQSNQGMDWNVGNLNTSNQQQANMTNAQMQQQTALANQQAQLQAAIQNQQAGLSANQQNIGAMGQAGQGLLGVGQGIGAYNQNLMQNWGAAGNTLQNLGQGYYDRRQQSAQNLWGGVNTATQPATGTLLGSPWGTTNQGQYQQRKKGGKLSIKV